MKTPLTRRQWWNITFVVLAFAVYLGLNLTAPDSGKTSPHHLSEAMIILLTATILGLWLLTCSFGLYAWLKLDAYAQLLPKGVERRAYDQIAKGVWLLAYGLLVSSILTASKPFFAGNASLGAVVSQINYYIIVITPFLGFLYLRLGTKRLAVSTQAAMTLGTKLLTVGPPVVLLASFYIFLVATNSGPDAQALSDGPLGFLMLPFNIALVVSSWTMGLLAALNVERATHRGESAKNTQALVKLYNGILTMTGGFIILDALMSLGTTRLLSLPLEVTVLLLYIFIGVVALGFMIVSSGARALMALVQVRSGR